MNELLRPETIEAIRGLAEDHEARATSYRSAAETYTGHARRAERCEVIARELREVVQGATHYRAYATTRWLLRTGMEQLNDGPPAAWQAVKRAPAVREDRFEERDGRYRDTHVIRLVEYADLESGQTRWALENTCTRPGRDTMFHVSDNALRQDAEYRYDELLGTLKAWLA